MKVRATVPVFITGISFPRKKPGQVDRAFVEMQDDADCHPFKVAVATADAVKLHRAIESGEDSENDDARGQITITYPRDEEGEVDERTKIVEWLRSFDGQRVAGLQSAPLALAKAIEEGRHLTVDLPKP